MSWFEAQRPWQSLETRKLNDCDLRLKKFQRVVLFCFVGMSRHHTTVTEIEKVSTNSEGEGLFWLGFVEMNCHYATQPAATKRMPMKGGRFQYEVWELQQHHRTLISHLYVLLPILFLTRQQEPYRAEIGQVGRVLLVNLLCFRCSHESELPDWIHAQYFGHLWTSPVPGRSTTASPQAADWADTLSIWIHPTGALSTKLGHRGEQEKAEATLTDLQRRSLRYDDEESQRLGLTLLHLLNTEPHTSQPHGDAWDGFMQVLAFSGDLLTSLTHAVSHPLAEDLYDLSLRGVESVYRGFLEEFEREEPAVLTMITALISEGLLATVLDKHSCTAKRRDPKRARRQLNSCCHSVWKRLQQMSGSVWNLAMPSSYLTKDGPNRFKTSL